MMQQSALVEKANTQILTPKNVSAIVMKNNQVQVTHSHAQNALVTKSKTLDTQLDVLADQAKSLILTQTDACVLTVTKNNPQWNNHSLAQHAHPTQILNPTIQPCADAQETKSLGRTQTDVSAQLDTKKITTIPQDALLRAKKEKEF